MHGKDVNLENVCVRFGSFTAVKPTNLHIKAGEFFSILGPSGCGKTTILRAISGLLDPSEGEILIGDEPMVGVGPHKRPTALIFQNLALFPLMSTWKNVAFGLEMRKLPKEKSRERAMELLDLVELREHADKLPSDLSGGQRQRVAIARALAVEPSVLLLDEPLSALDLKLRQHMRSELKEIQRKTGVTFIYITHDQGEALTMSDRIAVMKSGEILQVDTTDTIYDKPATPFVASFVGENNILRGRIVSIDEHFATIDTRQGNFLATNSHRLTAGDEAMLFIRPEKMRLEASAISHENHFQASFIRRDLEGPFVNLFFKSADEEIVVHQTNSGNGTGHTSTEAGLYFSAEDAVVMSAGELADE